MIYLEEGLVVDGSVFSRSRDNHTVGLVVGHILPEQDLATIPESQSFSLPIETLVDLDLCVTRAYCRFVRAKHPDGELPCLLIPILLIRRSGDGWFALQPQPLGVWVAASHSATL